MSVSHTIKRWADIFLSGILNDRRYLKIKYKQKTGRELDLDNPRTFNEKLQWLKLYNRKPEYTLMVDKYEAKKYIGSIIGEEYIIPLLGAWKSFDDIDFDALPQSFVLKTTHDSGGVVVCRDKNQIDKAAARKILEDSLKKDYYRRTKEWPYKNVPHRIIAEKFLDDGVDSMGKSVLTDYKFFCFDGEPFMMYVSKDDSMDTHTDFFDMDYNRLPIRMKDPNSDCPPPMPENYELMKQLARKLSAGIPHVRVDFYNINGKIYFGEITFFHNGGFGPVYPEEWALKLGDMIKLPK